MQETNLLWNHMKLLERSCLRTVIGCSNNQFFRNEENGLGFMPAHFWVAMHPKEAAGGRFCRFARHESTLIGEKR